MGENGRNANRTDINGNQILKPVRKQARKMEGKWNGQDMEWKTARGGEETAASRPTPSHPRSAR
jgi:hypothetical protein